MKRQPSKENMKRLITLAILSGALCLAPAPSAGVPHEKKLVARLTPDETKEYRGLQYILGDERKMEYLSLGTPRERTEWLEKFWLEVDPTPTTKENEARAEHEWRVETARQLFGTEKRQGWDDRIEIFIRFGPPSLRTSEMADVTTTGLTSPKEYWYYDALHMSVTFTDTNLQGRFTYAVPQKAARIPGPPEKSVTRLDRQSPRPFTPPNIDYIAVQRTRLAFEKHTPYQLLALDSARTAGAENNFSACLENFASIYRCDTDWLPLPLYFDVASFRGGDWSDRVDVSFEMPAKALTIGKKDGKFSADAELRVLVRDENMREVASDSVDLAVSGDALANAPLLPAQIVLALEPGRYNVGIEARDRGSNRRAAFRTKVDVPAYTGSPSISDIQFASSIEETEANRRFVKGNLQVVPHPLRAYRIPDPIMFYFEIYGLGADEDGVASYKVEYKIIPLEKRRWGPVLKGVPLSISSAFETNGYGRMQPQRLSIATDELWQGPFRLDVTVTDLGSRRTARQSAIFSIVE
jgi:GWxTD domain-containing protein